MLIDWQEYKLRECCKFNPASITSNWPRRSLRYIDISSVGVGIQTEPPKLFLRSEAPSRAQRLVAAGDCLLSTVRPNRRSVLWLGSVADDVVASTGFAVLRANPGVILPRYLYYTIFNQTFTDYLVTREKGAAYPAVSTADIGEAEIVLPPIAEQKAIATVLGALDDKIDLNRRMNQTLEAMAQALFQSWFVNATSNEMPNGWEVGPILNHCKLLSGGTPKTKRKDYWNGDILWASAKDVSQCRETFLVTTERSITEKGLEESATQLIPAFCTAVVARGATTGRMVMFGREMAMNQTCYGLASTTGTPFALYCQLCHEMDAFVHTAHGSVFDTITTTTFANSKVALPPKPLLEDFEERVSPLFRLILANTEESRTLAAMRDAQLPKLLSGELRAPRQD